MNPDAAAAWIARHPDAAIAPASMVTGFHAYLLTLPWAGAGLDWQTTAGTSLLLDGTTEEQVLQWVRHTGAGLHDYLLVIDSAREPGILTRLQDGIRDLDILTKRPEIYLCGADIADGEYRPVFGHFIERRSINTLHAPRLGAEK